MRREVSTTRFPIDDAERVAHACMISRKVLSLAHRGSPRQDFLSGTGRALLQLDGVAKAEIRLNLGDRTQRFCVWREAKRYVTTSEVVRGGIGQQPASSFGSDERMLDLICHKVARQESDDRFGRSTSNGSFVSNRADEPLGEAEAEAEAEASGSSDGIDPTNRCIAPGYHSVAVMRMTVGDDLVGLLIFYSDQADHFDKESLALCETVAQSLGVAISERRSQTAMRERVKELTCLYGIAKIDETTDRNLDDVLGEVVELLPPSWQYPEVAEARIVVDGQSHATAGYGEPTRALQRADVVVEGQPRGFVEVVYLEQKPEADEGPFLKEERSLIQAVAREVGYMLERRQAEHARLNLESQLRHADRLATIGQLAAGVAHELNEPLGAILGFAQLARKSHGLPRETDEDIEKIVRAGLHAREVVKKLMIFARQMPPQKSLVDLNQLVEDGLYFLDSRCQKKGIHIERRFCTETVSVTADPSQLQQVLVNLVVNAVQAMPYGGTIRLGTEVAGDMALLSVEDTGCGMDEETSRRAFLPFYTTKDVSEGTGLGLAVVHGIVTSHGGSIEVDSRVGRGTRFEVRLPLEGMMEERAGDAVGREPRSGKREGAGEEVEDG